MAMVKVTDANDRETYIPERWLNHPELGKGYKLVPEKAPKGQSPKTSSDKDK